MAFVSLVTSVVSLSAVTSKLISLLHVAPHPHNYPLSCLCRTRWAIELDRVIVARSFAAYDCRMLGRLKGAHCRTGLLVAAVHATAIMLARDSRASSGTFMH
eukprot:scaffold929_cov387-Prasinococcus_capsulatus_cf.AAC.10